MHTPAKNKLPEEEARAAARPQGIWISITRPRRLNIPRLSSVEGVGGVYGDIRCRAEFHCLVANAICVECSMLTNAPPSPHTTTYSERRRQVKRRPCAAAGLIFSFVPSAWPFEKQNAPCLLLFHIAISRMVGRVAGMDGSAPRKWAHTLHSARSLAPCIKRAIYFFSSLLFFCGTADIILSN